MQKTPPRTGQVYGHRTGDKNDRWAAIQIICTETVPDRNDRGSEDKILFMDLDCFTDRQPTIDDLKNTGPLVLNRFQMENELSLNLVGVPDLSTATLPADTYTLLGTLPLPAGIDIRIDQYQAAVSCKNLSGKTQGLSMEWPHSGASMEQWWMLFPDATRQQYKKSSREKADVSFFGQNIHTGVHRLSLPDNSIKDWSMLDQFGCLTALECEGRQDGLTDYLKTRPLIELLTWKNCMHSSLELRYEEIHSLKKIFLAGETLQEIRLGNQIESLTLDGKLNPALHIIQDSQGKNLTLTLWGNTLAGQVMNVRLPLLNGLMVFDKKVDASSIVSAYPRLELLDIRCGLGVIQHFSVLAQLRSLKSLTLFDAFGYTAEDFPGRSDWEKLDYLYIQSYPAEAGNKIKKAFSDCKSFELRLPKKPEWIADNLDNPFHGWEALEIPPAKVKKAVTAYKKTVAGIRGLKQPVEKNTLVPLLRSFVEDLNKLSDHIMTTEREDIYEVYQELLKKAGVYDDRDTYNALLDEWRDF